MPPRSDRNSATAKANGVQPSKRKYTSINRFGRVRGPYDLSKRKPDAYARRAATIAAKRQGITPAHHVREGHHHAHGHGHGHGHSSSSSSSREIKVTPGPELKNYCDPKQTKFQAYRRAMYRRLQARKRAEKEAALMGEEIEETPKESTTPMDVTTTTVESESAPNHGDTTTAISAGSSAPNHGNTTAAISAESSAANHGNTTAASSAQAAPNFDDYIMSGTTNNTLRRRYSSASSHGDGDLTQGGMISEQDLYGGQDLIGGGQGAPFVEERRILTPEQQDYVRRSQARRRAYLRQKERAAAAKMGIIIPPGPRGGRGVPWTRRMARTPGGGTASAAGTAGTVGTAYVRVEPRRAPEKVLKESSIEEIFADRQFGVRIEKIYDGVKYRGTIRNIEIDRDGVKRYLVVYDDEKTCEHMTLVDVRLYRMFLPTSHDELDETKNQLHNGNNNGNEQRCKSESRCKSEDRGDEPGGGVVEHESKDEDIKGDTRATLPQPLSSCRMSARRSISTEQQRSVPKVKQEPEEPKEPEEQSSSRVEQDMQLEPTSFHGEAAQTVALSTPQGADSGSKDNTTVIAVPPGGGILTDMDVDPCNFF